jgi:hypothetical protein
MTKEEKDAFLESTERVKRVDDFRNFLKYFNKLEDAEAKRTADMIKIQEEINALDKEIEEDTRGQATLGATTGVHSRLAQTVARKNERKSELLQKEEKLMGEGIDLDAIRKDVREMYLEVLAVQPNNGEKLFHDIEKIKDVSLREGLLRDRLISQLKARKEKSIEAPVEIPIKFEEAKADDTDKDDRSDKGEPTKTKPKMPLENISQSVKIDDEKPATEVKPEEVAKTETPFVGVAEIGSNGKVEDIQTEDNVDFNNIEAGKAGDSKPVIDNMPAIDQIIAERPVEAISTITEVEEPQTKEIIESLPDTAPQVSAVNTGSPAVSAETKAFLANKLDSIHETAVETPKELMSNDSNIAAKKPGLFARWFGGKKTATSSKPEDANSIFWNAGTVAQDDSEKWEKINADLINEREVANEQ